MSDATWGTLKSGDWSVASNWRNNAVPTATSDVTIVTPGPTITISTAASAGWLAIDAAATVDDKKSLTLGGPLVVEQGKFILESSGALHLTGAQPFIEIADGGEFDALGTQTLSGLSIELGDGTAGGAKLDFGALTLNAGLLFNGAAGSSAPSADTISGASLTNLGEISATNAASVSIKATSFTNKGILDDQSLSTFVVAVGSFTNMGKVEVSGAAGATLSATSSLTNDTEIDDTSLLTLAMRNFVDEGNVNVSGAASRLVIGSTAMASGSTTGSGNLNFSGTDELLEFVGVQDFSLNQTFFTGADASLEIAGAGSTKGVLTIGKPNAIFFDGGGANQVLGVSSANPSELINDGNIVDGFGGSLTFNVGTFVNNGYVTVGGGADVVNAVVKSALSGTGYFRTEGKSTLEIEGSVAAGEKFEISGELKLDLPSSFHGTLASFGTLDLAGILATSATWAANVLTIQESHAQLKVSLDGAYAGHKFTVGSDHAGGSLITMG